MKTRLGIVFGGKSGEHEVSILSARNIFEALDRERYDPLLVGVDRQGVWRLGWDLSFLQNPEDARKAAIDPSAPAVFPVAGGSGQAAFLDASDGRERARVDVLFPIMHGTFGEDGCLQGLLRFLEIPFVGASVLGSAVGMDKEVQKRLLREAGVPVPRFETVREGENQEARRKEILDTLGLPLFVKPACLGSSVGITKVKEAGELGPALDTALAFDTKALVEEAVAGREIECAVLGNEEPKASRCGEIVPTREFYSYEAKYLDESGALLKAPADLPDWLSDRIRALAVRTFRALECAGMGRVDFFLKRDGEVLVNEINTLPGFTRISMYPRLWELTGLPYPRLLDRLVELAFERFRKEQRLRRDPGLLPPALGGAEK